MARGLFNQVVLQDSMMWIRECGEGWTGEAIALNSYLVKRFKFFVLGATRSFSFNLQ